MMHPLLAAAVDMQSVADMLPENLTLEKILYTLVLFLVCCLLVKLLMRATSRILERSRLDKRLHTAIRSAVKAVLVFIAVIVLAEAIGINTSSLLAILSVAGLAVSLSIQDSLSNLASAIMILTAKPFKIGDFIEVKGKSGTVEQTGIIYTIILTPDNQRIHIPNSQITSNEITNFTAVGRRRVEINISASYDAPVEAVKAALLQAAAHPKLLPDEPVFARVSKYADSAVEYTLRFWTKPEDFWDTYYDVLEACKRAFDDAGIEMTYPHLNVHTAT
ncbi:MAG: mechanosensitive ion channel family protein [Clostridiales bacterium]|nr:mechanosensitive ion channel family protein [Clostridiales bacterium]